jgi:hypothetical protein
MTWCDYQDDEADRFRQLGCQADGAASYYRGSRFRATAPRPCSPVSCGVAAVRVIGTGEPL